MNIVINAAVPLTRVLGTRERVAKVQTVDDDGRPITTLIAGRPVAALEDAVIEEPAVVGRLTEDEQRQHEHDVLAVLAEAFQRVAAIDARAHTRFHGVVDLSTWEG